MSGQPTFTEYRTDARGFLIDSQDQRIVLEGRMIRVRDCISHERMNELIRDERRRRVGVRTSQMVRG